jgi:regulator of replication initiation timing
MCAVLCCLGYASALETRERVREIQKLQASVAEAQSEGAQAQMEVKKLRKQLAHHQILADKASGVSPSSSSDLKSHIFGTALVCTRLVPGGHHVCNSLVRVSKWQQVMILNAPGLHAHIGLDFVFVLFVPSQHFLAV